MYIEEIIIDGFKSYAQRVSISGFDKNFNAITGFNGSGKSNILDAICFVLGITQWGALRAQNAQDLIYKQGQAGVKRASVTIVFNNEDKSMSPAGYESMKKITVTRIVVLGGRSKFLINGVTAQMNRVHDLFQSVQLNIHNPHFLIMQGRITKVLNMKPPEILGMLEEAAGTRMFEQKKENALKTIEKKQSKVDEINKILNEEITPTINNLKSESRQYHQYLSNKTRIEQLTKFRVAYEYWTAETALQSSDDSVREMQETLQRLAAERPRKEEELEEIKERIQQLTQKKSTKMSEELKAAEKLLEKLYKECYKAQTEYESKKQTREQQEQHIEELKKQIEETQAALEQKKKEAADAKAKLAQFEKQHHANQDMLAALQLGATAMAAEGGEAKTAQAQYMSYQKQASELSTQRKALEKRIQVLQKELESTKREMDKQSSDFSALVKEKTQLEAAVKKLKEQLDKLDYNAEQEAQLNSMRQQEERAIQDLRGVIGNLKANIQMTDFPYRPPGSKATPDNPDVYGMVCRLVTIDKPEETALALEAAAGSKLFNVVIANHSVGSALLKSGQLPRRYTFIPLADMEPSQVKPLSAAQLAAAQKIGSKATVTSALSLVHPKYTPRDEPSSSQMDVDETDVEKRLMPALAYVWGKTLVCADSQTAQDVTFNKAVQARSVTLDGDVFEPAGLLTGGSKPSYGSILLKIHEYEKAVNELQTHMGNLNNIRAQLSEMQQKANEYIQLKQQLELKEHELTLVQQRIQITAHAQAMQRFEDLQKSIEQAQEEAKQVEEKEQTILQELKVLEARMKKGLSEEKDKEKELKKAKKAIEQSSKDLKAAQELAISLQTETEELVSELETLNKNLASAEAQLRDLISDEQKAEKTAAKHKEEYEKEKKNFDKKKEKIAECDHSIAEAIKERERLEKELTENDIETKKLKHRITGSTDEKKRNQMKVETLLKAHPWIQREKHLFNVPDGDYHFVPKNVQANNTLLRKLEEEQARLSKNINAKAAAMLEKAEAEHAELLRKRDTILNDKKKIEEVIKKLDEEKSEKLKATYNKVNKDFGSIFSTLLPGTQARLEPPEGQTIFDGLEVKVAFGKVWKDSLSDLSGGQKSLLALSLILALLLFNPAPMYILDEIDSALDLSHTQNIGQMLKTHFAQSQFIVVSLKEGMFNNANVIFRTKFVDGSSQVERIENRKKK